MENKNVSMLYDPFPDEEADLLAEMTTCPHCFGVLRPATKKLGQWTIWVCIKCSEVIERDFKTIPYSIAEHKLAERLAKLYSIKPE